LDLKELKVILNNNLRIHMDHITPHHPVSEVYDYMVFPPGKLFRPQLVWALASDFFCGPNLPLGSQEPYSFLASFVEIHHAYTLAHDDLPCMDDDEMRRNRPATHVAFGEWKALLCGDGLLNGSYGLLSKMKTPHLQTLFQMATWALGPKGLIHGQVMDLSQEMNHNFDSLLRTHELKTARLIQLCLVGGYLLVTPFGDEKIYKTAKDMGRLGKELGIIFQLLDDLTELESPQLSKHEQDISPWFRYGEQCYERLVEGLQNMESLVHSYHLNHFKIVFKEYAQKILHILEKGEATITGHLHRSGNQKANLMPVITLLKGISHRKDLP
jgi:geranylgeranyl pyrophosphate synthase